jgi:aldehyde:ferredoxin oxidoreductase
MAAMTMMCNTAGALPKRNFSIGEFEAANQLSGKSVWEVMLKRGKSCDPSHACMAGYVIQSRNVYATEDEQTVVSPLEYETLGLMGSNLGLGDPDAVARLNYICKYLGLDTIEIGTALDIACLIIHSEPLVNCNRSLTRCSRSAIPLTLKLNTTE